LKEAVLVSAKRSFKIFPSTDSGADAEEDFPFIVERLKKAASRFRSKSKHLLIIDGLDDILTTRHAQYQALAALILEADRLNLLLRKNAVPAKIIVLCRTDLFERLPGANKNKVRQDSAVQLDWYHDPRQPQDSFLVKLANLRASLSGPRNRDIFDEYFPNEVEHQRAIGFLLDLTRHTPRDFVQILTHVQQFSRSGALTRDQILSGIRSYSLNYFVPEIKDELVGYVAPEDMEATLSVIGALRKRDFNYSELEEKARSHTKHKLDLPSILAVLFECSAVGNVQNRPGGTTYYTFKYRNRNSTLNLSDRLILHKGMWKAMNLI